MELAEFSTAEEVSCIMNNTAAVETASNEDKKYQVKNYSPIERISAESMVKLATIFFFARALIRKVHL